MAKIKVVMIPSNSKNPYVDLLGGSLRDVGVEVRFLRSFKYHYIPINVFKLLYYRLRGFRVVHVHWLYIFPWPWLMKLLTFSCRAAGYGITWELHNIVAHSGGDVEAAKSRWFFDNCDAVIFHSRHDIARAAAELGGREKKLKAVAHHPNYIGVYENRTSREEARRALGVPEGKKVLLCFGQIRKNRGYEYLLEAVRGMDGVFLIIAGDVVDEDAYEYLKRHARGESVKLMAGWIKPGDVQLYFNAAGAVVLPYTEITTSGVIPLAYSFARPVIASRIGAMEEVVIDGKTGYLVEPRDEAALRRAVRDIFEADFEAMGQNALEFARETLGWKTAALEMKKLYQELQEQKGKGGEKG